jgi:membrane-bound serine protease (ClpP class)
VELWEVRRSGETGALTLQELERLERENAPVERVAVVSPPGKILSLTAGEAVRFGLARGLADDRERLLEALGAEGALRESVPGAADQALSWLSSGPVQGVLIILGLLLIFLEIQTPGFGLPGVGAILAFLAVFGSGALLGRVESLEILLFLLGLGLLAVEIFLLPGFGAAGISGILLIALSLILSMQDFVIPRFEWEWGLLGRNAVVVSVALLAAVLGLALIALLGPKIRIFDGLTLKTRITGTAAGAGLANDAGDAGDAGPGGSAGSLAGKRGIAVTTLRPSGKAEIEGRIYPVEGDGAFIEAGKSLEVIQVQGNRIVVRAFHEGDI